MKKIVYAIVASSLLVSSVNALECKDINKELKIVDDFGEIFKNGKASGEIRTVYTGYKQKDNTLTDTSATALGGALKYETANYYGLNAAFKLRYSEDVEAASGDTSKGERSDELSSGNAVYAQLSEAYLAYDGCFFDYKLGRQLIDTPLADSDDIRMIPNTFEAFVMQYPSETLNVTLGHLSRWQGVDAGLDDGWVKTGESGTSFVGVTYEDVLAASLWYYNISKQNSAIYADLAYTLEFGESSSLTAAVQYLSESEISNSGIEANIYGASVELVLNDLTLGGSYNASSEEQGKASFSGFGGGTLFTNMDTMILDEITADREASSYVAGASYALGDFSLMYAYGNFEGEADSSSIEAHIAEQDIGVEYNHNDELVAYIMYVISEDKLSQVDTDSDWNHIRLMVSYNF